MREIHNELAGLNREAAEMGARNREKFEEIGA